MDSMPCHAVSMVNYGEDCEDGDQSDERQSWCAGRQVMHGTISGYTDRRKSEAAPPYDLPSAYHPT